MTKVSPYRDRKHWKISIKTFSKMKYGQIEINHVDQVQLHIIFRISLVIFSYGILC